MFSITLICVGKCKEKFFLDAAAEYEKRLKGYVQFRLIERGPVPGGDRPGPCQRSRGHPEGRPQGGVALCADAGGKTPLLAPAG